MIRSALSVAALAGLLGACGDTYEDQVNDLSRHMSGNQIGSGEDYWLVEGSYRVALVFGFMDDSSVCKELADSMNERTNTGLYTCRSAN